LQELQEFKRLTFWTLPTPTVTDEGLRELKELKELTWLDLEAVVG